MKLQSKLALAFAGTLVVAAIAGCPTTTPTPTVTPTPGNPASKLNGRLTFALANDGASPGEVLTVKLKQALTGASTASNYTATASTDTAGNFSFSDLPNAKYQIWYDDEGKVASTSFNTTGVAVSDPVEVSSTQTAVPSQNMELAWDFTSGVVPMPNTNVTAGSPTSFSFKKKNGVSATDTVYQVTVFSSANTGSGAIVSSTPNEAATASLTIPATFQNASTAGTRYYVVKYYKKNGGFGNGALNYYGQTKPIPVTVVVGS
ncbi:hypothetical protein J7643_02290 [bacterium]|nr:hypothetical protein [bacterium]